MSFPPANFESHITKMQNPSRSRISNVSMPSPINREFETKRIQIKFEHFQL